MSSLGLKKGARAPSAITNEQHHDKSGSSKGLAGTPGVNYKIVDASVSAGVAVKSRCTIRVIALASNQFLWIGDDGIVPPANLDATNSLLLSSDDAPETFHMGDNKIIKSTGSVQIVVFE